MPNDEKQVQDENAQNNAPATPNTKEQLQALELEIKESRAAIDSSFIDKYVDSLNEEKEQQLFSDPKAFLQDYEAMKMQELKATLEPKLKQYDDLTNKVKDENVESLIQQAKDNLLAKYPKANPDEVMEFMQNDLSPKQLQMLQSVEPSQVLIKVYELMPQNKTKELPEELNDIHDDENTTNDDNDFMNRR